MTIVTRPGGATEITERYTDGRVKLVSGAGVLRRFYDYGVNAYGTQWTTIYTGPQEQNSLAWVKTTTNLLGQTIREERPGYGTGVILTTAMHYNVQGQLVRTETTGGADTLYAYDSLGNLTASGLDVDGDGALTAGVDRFSGTSTRYEYENDAWWQVTTTIQGNETTTTTTRLTGLGGSGTAGILTTETITADIFGQETISQTYIDRTAKTMTRITDVPQTAHDAVSVSINGLLVSSISTSNLTTTYCYDGLGRRVSVTDPRTGTSTTHYNAQGQVDWTRDAANHTTTYTYDPATGRRRAVTNALGQTAYYRYTLRGELEAVWGAIEPVLYTYDDYGRQHTLTTYRNLTAGTEPTAGTSGDTSTWIYDEAIGLLREKIYPDGKKTTYTSTPDGKRLTHTWARGVPTTYTYDPMTGDLLLVDYSDNTPDVTFADYDTFGRPHTVSDDQGTRTLSYAPGGGLSGDSLTGVGHTYTNGRVTGVNASGYAVTYGYDDTTGRFQSVTYQPVRRRNRYSRMIIRQIPICCIRSRRIQG